jgi:23S rRNA (guanosine2251-2'-O)-methyltransferase
VGNQADVTEFGLVTKRIQDKSASSKTHARRSSAGDGAGPSINSWSALEEYLRARPEDVSNIRCSSSDEAKITALFERFSLTPSWAIDSQQREGFVASIRISFQDEEAFYVDAQARQNDIIVACDHVTDTRNLGAIARSAAFFGCQNILLPKDRQAPINSACLGAAQGAFAWIKPVEVTNLSRSLEKLKACGYWILAADMAGTPLAEIKPNFEKTVLVLGSEDRGISPNILAKSDLKLSISSPQANLESLNVSVAAGILIHELRQRLTGK